MVFVETAYFVRVAASLFDDEGLRHLQERLLADPAAGVLIPAAEGLRKLRVELPGRGRRGGARVIYYWWTAQDRLYLLYAYAKNVQSDLTTDQVRRLAAVMRAETGNG